MRLGTGRWFYLQFSPMKVCLWSRHSLSWFPDPPTCKLHLYSKFIVFWGSNRLSWLLHILFESPGNLQSKPFLKDLSYRSWFDIENIDTLDDWNFLLTFVKKQSAITQMHFTLNKNVSSCMQSQCSLSHWHSSLRNCVLVSGKTPLWQWPLSLRLPCPYLELFSK